MVEPATAQRQIKVELSSKQETLRVGQTSAIFQATVYNDSDRRASFQIKLLAAGQTPNASKPWYRLHPSVSSKIPGGDSTQFQIEVFDLPPIAEQFRGAVDLTVEVTSRELDNQYDLEYLRLLVEGTQGNPPDIAFANPSQQAKPEERIVIGAQVYNPIASPVNVTLRLFGLPEGWFPNGTQHQLSVETGKPHKINFICEVPAPNQALSQRYPLRLEATGSFPTVTAIGEFYILPKGSLALSCDPLEDSIPSFSETGELISDEAATFTLQFYNQSNVQPPVQVTIEDLQPQRKWFWQGDSSQEMPDPAVLPPGLSLQALPETLPIGVSTALLEVKRPRPWLGWTRLWNFQVSLQTPQTEVPLPEVSVQNESETLRVQVFPVIPFWQQLLGLLLALGLGALTWLLLTRAGHRYSVNSVQFNGQGTEIVSGSDDQTVRLWHIKKGLLKDFGRLGKFDKAVRVVQYRPVNNDQVAIGFENGEVQLINLLTGQRSRLLDNQDDRVLALAFSRDARTLYSGHGSGLVLPWNLTNLSVEVEPPRQHYDVGFAIQAMTLVSNDDGVLAVAGRYNRLTLLQVKPTASSNREKPFATDNREKLNNQEKPSTPAVKPSNLSRFVSLDYPTGGSTDYISSLSVAQQQPDRLAVSDTQGRISLWDVPTCLEDRGRCDAIDGPWLGHEGSPVRSVALSANGCFLASAGDDGQVKLWPLDEQGFRRASAREGLVLARLKVPLNTVDVLQDRDRVWVVIGDKDKHVRLYSAPIKADNRPFDVCPVLKGGR